MKRVRSLPRRSSSAAGVVVALVLVAAAVGPGLAPAAKSAKPPCTRRALEAGLRRSGMRGRVVAKSWGCAGRFAYAAVVVHNIEITVLFRAHGDHWRTASRQKYCGKHEVPKRIYQPACETS
jgi:hypothetical protein